MAPNPSGERLQQLFLDASRLPVGDRDEWLRAKCAGDDQLLANVRSLLQYDDLPVDPLELGPTFPDGLPSLAVATEVPSPIVSGYRIVRELGTGGQAIVFEAIQESTTQRVALKMLRWGPMASTQERERLRREMLILARLSHPGIVSIIDSGETATGVFFIATKFVDGPSLNVQHETVTSEAHSGRDPQNEHQRKRLQMFVKVCDAVAAAHAVGVVHRDLKPANILIDELGEPRVLDFGLAKPSNVDWSDSPDGVELTRSGQFMGSLPWASPEQAKGERVDGRSDVYSLGVILYQLLTGGKFPYKVVGSMHDVLHEIINAKPTPPSQIAVASEDTARETPRHLAGLVSPDLEAIVLKALAKSPDERFQSAADLAAAIKHYWARTDYSESHVRGSGKRHQFMDAARWMLIASLVITGVALLIAVSGGKSRTGSMSAVNGISTVTTRGSWVPIEVSHARAEGESYDELAFPALGAEKIAIRGSIRRERRNPVTVTLHSTEGMSLTLLIQQNGQLKLSAPGHYFAHARTSAPNEATEFVFAMLPNRCLVAVGNKWLMQLHFKTTGRWHPAIDSLQSAPELRELRYSWSPEDEIPSLPRVAEEEQAALDFVMSADGSAASVRDDEDPNLFRVQTIVAVNQESTDEKDAELISHCGKLSDLMLTRVNKNGLSHLTRLPMLDGLAIWDSLLSAGCIEDISHLDKLTSLDLWNTDIENVEFASLASSGRLEYLRTSRIEVTDEHLQQLAEIKSLKALFVNGRFATSDGVKLLAQLRHLEELEVSGGRLSGQIAETFSRLRRVTWLNLHDSDLRDADIEDLSQLRHLRVLDLEGSNLSQGGLQKLAELLPNCQINPTPEPKSD